MPIIAGRNARTTFLLPYCVIWVQHIHFRLVRAVVQFRFGQAVNRVLARRFFVRRQRVRRPRHPLGLNVEYVEISAS